MIKSMTGYGRGERTDGLRVATAEIRAVNHRYCEVSVKIPGRYGFAEDAVRSAVRKSAMRGKIDVLVMFASAEESDALVQLNAATAKQYFMSLRELQRQFDVTGDISLEMLAMMPDVLKPGRPELDEDAVRALILGAVTDALAGLSAMRASEGANLKQDILQRLAQIDAIADEIKARAPEVQTNYAAKLRERVTALLDRPGDAEAIEQRLALEIVVFADKASVDEELVRLASHTAQLTEILAADGDQGEAAVGKKLDFLVQELNREANTIGAKANDLKITDLVIALKNEIENIREQVQNIL